MSELKLDQLKKNIPELFNSMTNINDDVDVKYNGRWEGKVINNNDPEKLGRVQIQIFNFYDDLPKDGIPWALPDIMFIGAKAGNFIVPENGTLVSGYFDQGDIHKPIYDKLSFNKESINSGAADQNEDYPHKMIIFQTDQGDYMTLNRKTGEMALLHRTGAALIFKGNGEIQIDTGVDEEDNQGDLVISINGNCKINSNGDTEVTSIGTTKVDGLQVELGKNAAKQLVDNLPNCLVTGAPHFLGNTNVKC